MNQSESGSDLSPEPSTALEQPGCGSRRDPRFEPVEEIEAYCGARYRMNLLRERLPDQRIVDRDVLRHPGAAAILPLLDDGSVVLIEQHRSAVGHNLLEIPAGLIEPGERPQDCADRELREETGYVASSLVHMLDYFPAVGFSDERMSIFLARELEFVGQEPDEDEWVVTHICSRDRIEQLLGSQELLDGKTLVALLHWLGRDR